MKLNANKSNMDSLTQETACLLNTKHPQILLKCLQIPFMDKIFL